MFAQQLPLFDVPMVAPNRVRRRRVERGRQQRSMVVQLTLPLCLRPLTPFEQRIVDVLSSRPISTTCLSTRLAVPERTMRWYLLRLECGGFVRRLSPKSGWVR